MKNSPKGTRSQLLNNRGILTKINPVVRKKSKQTNIQVPNEWNEKTARAYRLLVGPQINKFVDIKEPTNIIEIEKVENKNKDNEIKNKLLNQLTPSRLKQPYQTLNVTPEQLDALHLPSDLLFSVGTYDVSPNFEFLTHSTKKNIKINNKKTPISQLISKNHSNDLINSNNTIPLIEKNLNNNSNIKIEMENIKNNNNEEEIINTPIENIPNIEEIKKKNKKLNIDNVLKNLKKKSLTKLRTYFYVFRCWASYNINSRKKSSFILNVHETQILIHIFHQWFIFVSRKNKLNEIKEKTILFLNNTKLLKIWKIWKKKSLKAINNATTAGSNVIKRNLMFMKLILKNFYDATKSKRICRREIRKNFRYNQNGPFQNINHYYTIKRNNIIKSLHFYFIKIIPPILKSWKQVVISTKNDILKTQKIKKIFRISTFWIWYELFKNHFHNRVLHEIRKKGKQFLVNCDKREKEMAEKVEKSVMIQLIHERNILNTKLNQFDRLSENHNEAVLRRKQLRNQISETTNEYFKRQEDLQFIDFNKQSNDIEKKTKEIRLQLAEGFLYHLGRAVRSYDNQVVAHEFCLSFRVLSEPIVQKAVGYFYEKKHLKLLISHANQSRLTLQKATKCSKLFHQNFGWTLWRKFIEKMNENRSSGMMSNIRRRTTIMQLYPYFNWIEVLPVRPPRPLKEVETMFKDLPLVSIQRKIARERVHHVNVRMMLMRRRILRDFLRSFAAFVQEQIAIREVIKLLRLRQNLILKRKVLNSFKIFKNQNQLDLISKTEKEITSNILGWFRHFFRERVRQKNLIKQLPLS